jgi:hypothetical protein
VSSNCSESIISLPFPESLDTSQDIRRMKRLLRHAIAASQGQHRIRLQRELAALEDYERTNRQQRHGISISA